MRMTETTSHISPVKPVPVATVLNYRTKRMYRRRGLYNLLKMGHCAPAGEAFLLMFSHLTANDFHCAHAVLKHMGDTIPVIPELLDGTSGFIGGTAFKGLTCSAYTAGLMAVGLKLGEIEDSYLRVIRMLTTMIVGGNAFAEHLNKFNRLMNIGHRMSKWFREEFGSTLCREVTQRDFSSLRNVHRYIEKDSVTTCKVIAEKVARQAERIIKQKGVGF